MTRSTWVFACVAAGVAGLSARPVRGQNQDGTAAVGSRDVAAVTTVAPAEMDVLLREAGLGTPPRDPFGTTLRMKEAAGASGTFVPSPNVPIPKMILRGYVEMRQKKPLALIEVEGAGTYLVRAGDTIGLTLGGRNTVLRIQAVDQSSAKVEAGTLGQVIVVR